VTRVIFLFSLQSFYKIFFILRGTEGEIIQNIYRYEYIKYRCSCSMLMKLEFSGQIFEKFSNIEFLLKSTQQEPSCSMRTDVQTDRRDEANSFAILRTRLKIQSVPHSEHLLHVPTQYDDQLQPYLNIL
jgi:hypothetical protein